MPAISISLPASAVSTPPSTLITRSNRSILPVRPSTAAPQSSQCSAATLPCLTLDRNAAERKLLVLRIDAKRHRGARPESCCQIVIGAWTTIKAAHGCGLVGKQAMAAGGNRVLEFSRARFGHHDTAVGIGMSVDGLLWQVA